MATKKVYIASYGPYLYDDTEDIDDVDGDFLGQTRDTIVTDGYIKSTAVPSVDADMVRKEDLDGVEGDIADHVADTTTHGTTGDIVGTSDAQIITNKRYGGAANYSEFEADGTLHFVGDASVFRDELFELIGEKLESPSSDITVDVSEAAIVFEDGCTLVDYVTMNVQLNHDWKVGSTVFPHLHWWQDSSDLPNWLLQYRWQYQGAAKTTAWTDLPRDSEVFTYSAGTLNQITDFGGITPGGSPGISDILQIRILRDTDNDSGEFIGTDPLTGDANAVQLDVHIEIDTVGSRTEYSK